MGSDQKKTGTDLVSQTMPAMMPTPQAKQYTDEDRAAAQAATRAQSDYVPDITVFNAGLIPGDDRLEDFLIAFTKYDVMRPYGLILGARVFMSSASAADYIAKASAEDLQSMINAIRARRDDARTTYNFGYLLRIRDRILGEIESRRLDAEARRRAARGLVAGALQYAKQRIGAQPPLSSCDRFLPDFGKARACRDDIIAKQAMQNADCDETPTYDAKVQCQARAAALESSQGSAVLDKARPGLVQTGRGADIRRAGVMAKGSDVAPLDASKPTGTVLPSASAIRAATTQRSPGRTPSAQSSGGGAPKFNPYAGQTTAGQFSVGTGKKF